MAYFTGNWYSSCLKQDTQIGVILPQDGRRYIWDTPPKTLILLHGLSDNAATWVRRTAIERYAERYNLAVLMPEVQRSWYVDMLNGIDAESYITKELPELAHRLFSLSIKREDLLIAGLSMGGYGALRCAIKAPEVFGYCGAFSGAYDFNELMRMGQENPEDILISGLDSEAVALFGSREGMKEKDTIPALIEEYKTAEGPQSALYMMCGTEDFIYGMTKAVRPVVEKTFRNFTYEEWPGIHEWDMWDTAIEKMLKLFLGEGRKDT